MSVPKGKRIRDKQRALLQYRNPDNYELVGEALVELGRKDLIGSGKKALIAKNKGLEKIVKQKKRQR